MDKGVDQRQEPCFGFTYERGDTCRLNICLKKKRKRRKKRILEEAQRNLHGGGVWVGEV